MEIEVNYTEFEKQMAELEKTIERLDPAVRNLLYSEMTIASARTFAKHAKASPRFRDQSGKLRKSIRAVRQDTWTEEGQKVKGGAAQAIIGGKRAPHANLIEYGTVDRVQSTTGRRTGRVMARNPLGDAWDTQQGKAAEAATAAGAKNFDKMVNAAKGRGTLTRRAAKIIGEG